MPFRVDATSAAAIIITTFLEKKNRLLNAEKRDFLQQRHLSKKVKRSQK